MKPTSFDFHHASTAAQTLVRERRVAGGRSFGIYDLVQPAGDLSDPAYEDVVIATTMTRHRSIHSVGGLRQSGRVVAGQVIIAPPGAPTTIHTEDASRFLALVIPAAALAELMPTLEAERMRIDYDALNAQPDVGTLIAPLLKQMWLASDPGQPPFTGYGDHAITFLIHEVARLSIAKTRLRPRGGLASWQQRRVLEHLHTHLADELQLAQLAALTGLSTFHFARAFKQSTGSPPHAYIRALRGEKARRLLEETKLSVTEIAFEVGYDSAQALARAFRRETGVSPGEYRRQRLI